MKHNHKIGDIVEWTDTDSASRPKPALRLPTDPHQNIKGRVEPEVIHRGRIVGFEEDGLLEGERAIVDCGGLQIKVPLSRLRR